MNTERLSVMSGDAAMQKVLIIEETNVIGVTAGGKRVVPRLFLRRSTSQRGSSLVPLDDSIERYVEKIHVIFPTVCQFYCATHLECNPHYTVEDGAELSRLVRDAIGKGIAVKYYPSDRDHLNDNCVRVLNNVHLGNYSQRIHGIPWSHVFHAMRSLKTRDEMRGSYTSHVGFSATLGQGWHKPYPELDPYAGDFGLCKPGITSSMPETLLSAMGPALTVCGELSRHCWGQHSMNYDMRRQTEFSDVLRKYLGCSEDVLFEAGTFALLSGRAQNLAVHTDILNDSTTGYEKTGVLSLFVTDSQGVIHRITVIGYNRKCCHEFMLRYHSALCNRDKSMNIASVLQSLQDKKRRSLRIIEAATIMWLSATIDSWKGAHLGESLTETELATAREIMHAVSVRGLQPTQEQRPQIAGLKRIVFSLFRSTKELVTNIDCICRALTFVIYAHAKNHKLDGMRLLGTIKTREELITMFSSYDRVLSLLPPPADEGSWIDVYGEYTFAKLYGTYNPAVYDERLQRFSADILSEQTVDVEVLVRKLKTHKVFVLGGRQFQMFVIVLFKELGLVKADMTYETYLPKQFTKTSGSVKVLQRHAGMADPYVCREYMRRFSSQIGISAITYENILCKIHVGYYVVQSRK